MRHGHGRGRRWGQQLECRGFRVTAARELILEILSDTDSHLSAEEIYFTAREENPSVGLTTVYRSLELLQQNGIVNKFDFGDGRAKFELTEEFSSKPHHHHLICRKCGKIVDYTDFNEDEKLYVDKAEDGLQSRYGFDIDSHIIRFYGTCPECKK